jgi:hypothetical protein
MPKLDGKSDEAKRSQLRRASAGFSQLGHLRKIEWQSLPLYRCTIAAIMRAKVQPLATGAAPSSFLFLAHGGNRMSNLRHNERVKLDATFFNNVAVASLASGAIIPVVSLSVAGKPFALFTFLPLILGGFFCVLSLIAARSVLKGLKE